MIPAGKFRFLHKYLQGRYADTVVLTFQQIEDLLGFALPARARTDPAWWTVACATDDNSGFSDAWTMASRTASPNLLAKTVLFERIPGASEDE